MRKFLMSVLFVLGIVYILSAQTLSGNKVVDGMLQETDYAAVEKMFAEMGVKIQLRGYFDTEKNQLVNVYQVFDQQLYDEWNIEKSLDGCLSGMLNETMKQDDSGNFVIWVANEFKRTNTGVRIEVIYKDRKKTAAATADDIIEIVYNRFQ